MDKISSNPKKENYLVEIGLFLYFIFSYLRFIDPQLRYLKYILPVVSVYLLTFSQNEKKLTQIKIFQKAIVTKSFNLYLFIYGIALLIQLLSNSLDSRFFANFYFVIAPLATVRFMTPLLDNTKSYSYFKYIFIGSSVGYILERGSQIFSFLSNYSNLYNNILNSEAATESNIYPFVFSFLLIYAIIHKLPKQYIIISILFIILGFKRIVFISLILTAILYIYYRHKEDIYFIIKSRAIALIYLIFSFSLMILYIKMSNGEFDIFINSLFNITTNQLLMGRQHLYFEVLKNFKDQDLYFGIGIGKVDNLLLTITADRQEGRINNLHSELLRLFIEMGSILFSIWLFFKIKFMLVNKFIFFIFFILFICLTSDNILIYYDCMFIFYILLIISVKLESNHLIGKIVENHNEKTLA